MPQAENRHVRSLPDWAPYGLVAALISAFVLAVASLALWVEAERSRQAAITTTQNLALV